MPDNKKKGGAPEVLNPLNLVVLGQRELMIDKHAMIGFGRELKDWNYTPEQAKYYRWAIEEIIRKTFPNATCYQQVGDEDSREGPQLWEIWDRAITKEQLQSLIPEIHARAQAIFNEYKKKVLSYY